MMGTAVVVLAVQSFAEQDTIPAITWVTTASGESAEFEPQTEPLETEADSENANRQPVFDWDKPTKAETTTKSAGSTTAPVRQTEPAQPDAAELAFPEEAEPEISYPLDLNAATAEELETLPGVGAILAERIVSYREAVGGFQTLEELQQVNGIGFRIHSPSGHQHRHGRRFSKAAERHTGTGGSHCSAADTDSVFSEYL